MRLSIYDVVLWMTERMRSQNSNDTAVHVTALIVRRCLQVVFLNL